MAKALVPILGIVILIVVAYLIYVGVVAVNRRHRFKAAEDEIKLDKIRKMTELDLKLAEWQATSSLEDLTEHRARLRRDLDKLHTEIGTMPSKPGELTPPIQ